MALSGCEMQSGSGQRVFSAAIGLLMLASVAAAQSSLEPIPLAPGESYSHEHGVGEPVLYSLSAESGEIYLLSVLQEGLDFIVFVRHPDGSKESFNTPLRRDGYEYVIIDTQVSGDYVVTIDSKDPTYARGEHTLTINSLATTGDAQQPPIEGYRQLAHGAAAYDADNRDAQLEALDFYRSASARLRQADDASALAQSLYSEAMLEYWAAYDWARSSELAEQAAIKYENLGRPRLAANARMLAGAAMIESANEMEQSKAMPAFERALGALQTVAEFHRANGHYFDHALTTNNIGLTYFYIGNWDSARATWEETAAQFHRLGEWREEFISLQNVAVVDGSRGYNARAIESLQYIADELPTDADPQFRVEVLDNLAANLQRYGKFERALSIYTEARQLHAQIGDGIGEAYSLSGIGTVYFNIGELDLAERYLQLALPLARDANDGRSEEAILATLGDIKYKQSSFGEALALHESAAELATGDAQRAKRLLLVARDQSALSRYGEARKLASEASLLADRAKSPATVADAEIQIGRAALLAGETGDASKHFREALGNYTTLGLKAGQAAALDGLASAARAEGRLEDAISNAQQSVTLNESVRAQVASPELRAHYSAASRRYFQNLIDLQMSGVSTASNVRVLHFQKALTTSENARSRLTIDLLNSASVNLRSNADSSLLAKERELLDELAAKSQQRDRLLRRPVDAPDTEQALAELDTSMTDIENQLHVLDSAIHKSDPAYASLSRLSTLTGAEIQNSLDEETVLLQFALGENGGFVWAVSRQSIESAEIGSEAEIESLALQMIQGLRSPTADAESTAQLHLATRELAKRVLDPFSEILSGKQRILVAPDGPLEYIPFAMLPHPSDVGAAPLLERFEVVTVPSMTVVTALRTRGTGSSAQNIAIFADPVIDESDPRLSADLSLASADTRPNDSITRSSRELRRLPATGVEAREIAALLPENKVHVAVGFEASRPALLEMDLTGFRFLHFAMHGIVDSQHPNLSSLAMSGFTPSGERQEGMLRLYEIFDLDLNAQLVVLSACDTALGQQIRGEGLVGLAQGFMYAGARSIVASLWQVSDRATAEMMTRFYGYLLDEENPLQPAAALRSAQMDLAGSGRWSHPYFWSAFVLLGDWQ